jgi:hypothetical protein
MRCGVQPVRVMAILWVMVVLAVAGPCLAGRNQSMKCAVHVRAHNAKQGCDNLPVIEWWYSLLLTYEGASFDAFPVFFDLYEYLGVQYGLTWPDWTYSAAFTSCSDLVIGSVTTPGTGAAHAWTSCQSAGVAIPSFVWLYADGHGHVCLTNYPESNPPRLWVLDCAEGLDGPVWGYCDCAEVYTDAPATEPTTWGSVKSLFAE